MPTWPTISSTRNSSAGVRAEEAPPAAAARTARRRRAETDSAEDDNGHGTSVSGIITSAGVDAGLGVAPDADIVALKVLDADGSGYFSDIAAALDWLISNHASLGVRVVNLSLGDGAEYSNALASPCSGSNTANAIHDLVVEEGVVVFASSGNEAYDDGISLPACVPEAISVGGVYDANVGGVSWCGETCDTILCTDSSTFADKFVCHTNSDELLDLLAPDWRTSHVELGRGERELRRAPRRRPPTRAPWRRS